jgi:hypothetical protein
MATNRDNLPRSKARLLGFFGHFRGALRDRAYSPAVENAVYPGDKASQRPGLRC